MKRILLLFQVLCVSTILFAGSFKVRVNGTTDYSATVQGDTDAQGRTQYLTSNLKLSVNDLVSFYDVENNKEFYISTIDPYGEYQKFDVTSIGLKCKTEGCYDIYLKLKYEDDIVYIGAGTGCDDNPTNPDTGGDDNYTSSVPSACQDIMIQAFYWDSNQDKAFGNTKWTTLDAQASELAAYYDLVWLAPSAKSSGGVGYHPKQLSNQNSSFGSVTQLKSLISHLHAGEAKVIADIVVNHRDTKSSWCDFYSENFGTFGKFQLEPKHICKDDEVNYSNSGSCKGKATGANDTGEKYGAARDLDHTNPYVRNTIKAYLKWMKSEMKYDGWRWDVAKGFTAGYFNEYNQDSKAYLSVGEYLDGNLASVKGWIDGAGKNSLAFDYPTKFAAINGGIKTGNYSALRGAGLLGAGYAKYAVTFVDNHDTYERGNDMEFAKVSDKYKIMHANAYILSMPGIPCVFYPHWVTYKSEIKDMILARKAVGVHSESPVTDEYVGNQKYECTVQGTNGYLILRLGHNSAYATTPNGYTKAASGMDYAIFIKTNTTPKPKLSVSPAGGTYIGGTTVSMTALHGGNIYYTLDGTEPTTASTLYTTPISISQKNETQILKVFATNAGGQTSVQSHEYITYVPPRTEGIKVSFKKPTDWTTVNLWAWDDNGQLFPTSSSPKWPGEAITDEGNGWWSYTFDKTINTANIIFNNGQSSGTIQTDDIVNVTESTCYIFAGNHEIPTIDDDCNGSGNSINDILIEKEVSLYPNPSKDQFYIETKEAVNSVRIYNYLGALVSTPSTLGTFQTIDVSHLSQGVYFVVIEFIDGEQTMKKFIKE